MTKVITIATHNGSFHIDDLFAVGCVQKIITTIKPEVSTEVIRTRDAKVINEADWVVDVGKVYDHKARRYDHHQLGAPTRDNNVPYAAFGLIWKHWGGLLCNGNELVAEKIDREFIQMLDGPDNGFETSQSLIDGGRVPALSMLASLWRPAWNEKSETNDDAFMDLLPIVEKVLDKLIDTYLARHQAEQLFDNEYQIAKDKQVIVVPKGVWPDDPQKYPNTIFIVSHDQINNTWKAVCVTEHEFECRVGFPNRWRGLSGSHLQEVSGVGEAEFVHLAGFLAVAKSQSAIMKMCQIALDESSYQQS